jgi:hypothetical protein
VMSDMMSTIWTERHEKPKLSLFTHNAEHHARPERT